MIKDSFFNEILRCLSASLDGNLFERCSCALLRKVFPTLVPIPGGMDSGMDGATAEPGPFLVCTTDKNVIRNLTKSIKSYLKEGGLRREVILSTSQSLTKRKRTNLENRGREFGFHLIQIYDRAILAELLYYDPFWCKELLGLSGRPSALTVIPQSQRLLLDIPLIGRDNIIENLEHITNDLLIVGQPGSGKTFLLRALALKGLGLFLVDSDKTAITEAVRSQQPRAVIVDDANFQIELLTSLRQLRSEIGADFAIVAASWDGDRNHIAEALSLSSSQIVELDLLTRDEIVRIINSVGVAGPRELIREIVDQAEGRPGLAVTLSHLCMQGDVRKVVFGDSLSQSLGVAFQRLVGRDANQILAVFAFGGDSGMQMDVVAKFLNIPLAQLHVYLARLAAGGVIRESRAGGLSVWPNTLRYVLVRDTFFNGVCKFPTSALMQAVPDESDMALTLVESARRGAVIPQLRSIIESINSFSAWKAYASLGESEAKYALTHNPELLTTLGQTALEMAAETTLPMLLDESVGDERDLHNSPDHKLRWIEDWIHRAVPSTPAALRRRKLLVDVVTRWMQRGGDERVAQRALSLATIPIHESHSIDPGSGRTFNIHTRLLELDELVELGKIWDRIIDVIESLKEPSWLIITKSINQWAYPEVGRIRAIPENTRMTMQLILRNVLEKLSAISRNHPGVQQWLRELADDNGFEIETICDAEFDVLYPIEDINNFEETRQSQVRDVLRMADDWLSLGPDEVACRIMRIEAEAGMVGKNYPRMTDLLAAQIASQVPDPMVWIDRFLSAGLPADVIWPFLCEIVNARASGWKEVLYRCLGDERYTSIAVRSLLINSDLPSDLIHQLLNEVAQYPDIIKVHILRNEIPEETMILLLQHEDNSVSTAAAIGEWVTDPSRQVRPSLAADWRRAVIRAQIRDYWIRDILKHDSSLAFDWFMASVEREEDFFIFDAFRKEDNALIVAGLNFQQRIRLLDTLHNKIGFYDLVEQLVGDDVLVYQELLRRESLFDYHLCPLKGRPTEVWARKAVLALEAGYEASNIAEASVGEFFSLSWDASAECLTRLKEFEDLNTHPDPRVHSIAQAGVRLARERAEKAAAYERKEAIYGLKL